MVWLLARIRLSSRGRVTNARAPDKRAHAARQWILPFARSSSAPTYFLLGVFQHGNNGPGPYSPGPYSPLPYFCSAVQTFSAVYGLCSMRTPAASKMALEMAGSGPLMQISLTLLAPYGPEGS